MHPDLADLQQMAAQLRVHSRTVVQWVESGAIPGAKIGRDWRFHRPSVERAAAGAHETWQVPEGTEPQLITAEEAADLLGLHVVTVRRLLRTDALPSLRPGKGYRVRWPELLQDIANGRSHPPA